MTDPYQTQVLAPTSENLQWVAHELKRGEIGAIPSETVYGLGAHAFFEDALEKIFEAKARPHFDPLIIHLQKDLLDRYDLLEELERQDLIQMPAWSTSLRDSVNALLRRFWPGPLTVILPKSKKVPDLATASLPTVALRMPRHSVFQEILKLTSFPIAAPSANRFGQISPTSASDVLSELGSRIPWIVDSPQDESCRVGIESTVIDLVEAPQLRILRPGQVDAAQIEKLFPEFSVKLKSTLRPNSNSALLAPGLLKRHYAPRKELWVLSKPFSEIVQSNQEPLLDTGFLFWSEESMSTPAFQALVPKGAPQGILTKDPSDITQAAQNLYRQLRWLDEQPCTRLVAEPLPQHSDPLCFAMKDRLQKASEGRVLTLTET